MRTIVGIAPANQYEKHARLFEALEQLFPITLQVRALDDYTGLHSLILLGASRETAAAAAQRGIPCFVVLAGKGPTARGSGNNNVQFGKAQSLEACLRGQTLAEPANYEFVPVACEPADEWIASKSGHPVWVHQRSTDSKAPIDFVALPLPVLNEGSYLCEHFNEERFLALLPLIQYLRRITANHGWQAPPRRACLVFDDANLRWRTYGCINFRRLAEHARSWNYHAAIGLIPLDTSWVNTGTATLFLENAASLSLVIHGNNHVYLEMAQKYSDLQRTALLAQAWRRVAKMEHRYGVQVCRLMESPFGVISHEMFKPLVALGYEAATITPRQFLRYNGAERFSASIALHSAECSPGGLGLLPRLRLSSPHWKTEALLAAFLGQPIVIAGHHWDAADGFRLMENIATVVNGLGPVRWCRLTEITRTNYTTRRQGTTLVVRMASRRIELPVPEEVETIQIERLWLNNGEQEPLTVRFPEGSIPVSQACGRVSAVIHVAGTPWIEVLSPALTLTNPDSVPAPRQGVWPVVRRILTEARDRAYPFVRWR